MAELLSPTHHHTNTPTHHHTNTSTHHHTNPPPHQLPPFHSSLIFFNLAIEKNKITKKYLFAK